MIDWLIDWLVDRLMDWMSNLLIDWLVDRLMDWMSNLLIDWLIDWLVGRWMNNKLVEWLTGHYVCCVSSEMYFPLHKMHGRRTVRPVTWIAQNSRTDKCHINHYSFEFHISFKRCRWKERLWTTSQVRCPWIFHTLPHFYHKLSCFTEFCTTLRPLLLFLSTTLQLLVQSFDLLNHFLPSSPILDNGLPTWHF
jgi:hypothetical protein